MTLWMSCSLFLISVQIKVFMQSYQNHILNFDYNSDTNMSLKDYEILNKLGSGSFGVVYKAKPRGGEPICVLKEVELKSMDKKMRQWAMNEVKIMKNIDSQYIVKYKQSFIEKEKLYICMEYCSGGDLAQFLKAQMGKPVAEDTVWRFALQIMLGLRDLHRKKILHRDIKSMNVFLNQNKTIKIGDLGVAKTMTGDFARTIVGTPYYLSPEMCEQKPYNQKTDVWAMGCLIYELCTGKHPFQANTQAALALKIVMGKYAAIPTLYSQLMSWLIRVCLEIDYKRRPTIQYILDQANVINMAKKVGIELCDKQTGINQKETIKQKVEVVHKQPQKIEKVQNRVSKNAVVDSRVSKKIPVKQQVKKTSLERNKVKSIEKNVKVPSNINAINKDNKAEQKGYNNMYHKNMPPKEQKKTQVVEVKKIQSKDPKLNNKGYVSPTNKNTPQIKQQIKQQVKEVPVAKKIQVKPQTLKVEQVRQIKKSRQHQSQILLPLQSKPKKSVQQLVDDDELFNDFGITPEKLSMIHEQVEFKKVSPINWNVEVSSATSIRKEQKVQFKQLPTIKTPSSCEFLQIQCKEMEEEQEILAQQIDDNAPYKSDQEIETGIQQSEDNALVENSQQVEQDAELKKKEKLLILQKRMIENEKRRNQLLELKKQRQKEIMGKLGKQKYEKIKAVMKDGSDEDIQKIMMKECTNVGITAQFYKIIYNQMQIQRCEDNINKCIASIKQLDTQK